MSNTIRKVDVCIVGGGFAGLNSALLLAREGISCEVFTTGYGASNLWMGTFDFLNYKIGNIEEAFHSFKKDFPYHPYAFFQYEDALDALEPFSKDFPDILFFTFHNKLVNKMVLTSLGTFKPCLAIWKSLFHEFEALNEDSNVIIISFDEFNNSSLYLVKKGLEENYPSNFAILNLSFNAMISEMNEGSSQAHKNPPVKLSEFKLGNFFDTNYDRMEPFSKFLLSKLKNQIPEFLEKKIDFFLFPPVLGVNRNPEILHNLSINLDSKCKELIALSPSLIANRLLNRYEMRLKEHSIEINKGWTLMGLESQEKNNHKSWKLMFEDKKGNKDTLACDSIIFSTGSMFQAGIFETERNMREIFNRFDILIPNELDSSFQLTYKGGKKSTNIFVSGSAIYNFIDQISDEVEIKYGTGLALPIISSYKAVKSLLANR